MWGVYENLCKFILKENFESLNYINGVKDVRCGYFFMF